MENTSGLFFFLVPWIVFLPVIGLLVNISIGSRLGEKGVGAVAAGASGLAFVVSLLQVYSLSIHPEGAMVRLADWIHIGTQTPPLPRTLRELTGCPGLA